VTPEFAAWIDNLCTGLGYMLARAQERCVERPAPRSDAEAEQRASDRAEVDAFLRRCR
jgi:hypothetical protein